MPLSDGRRIAPFAICVAVGVLTLLFPPYVNETRHIAVAALLVVVVGVAAWTPRASRWQVAPPMLFFLVIMVLRDGSGGSVSGLAPLVGLPVMWIALYGTRAQMWLAAGATGVVFLAPLLVVGEPDYPLGDWRRALLWVSFAALIGPVVQGVVHELSERERAQSLLAAHLDGVLRAATRHSIIATTPEGLVTTFNEGAERMLGYRAADVIGRESPSLFHDAGEIASLAAELGVDPGFEVFVEAARGGEPDTREWSYIHASGRRLPVRLTVTAMRDQRRHVVGFIGIATDIAVERAAMAELTAAEQRWRVLLDHLPDTSVLTVGPDLRYQVAVGAGLVQQGMSDATGKSLFETSSAENAAILEPAFRQALRGEEAVVEIHATHTGSRVEIAAVPLPAHNGAPEALIVGRDVTEARVREAVIEASKQRLARLFAEAPYGVAVLSPVGVINDANPALCAMVGRTAERLIGQRADVFGVQQVLLDRFFARLKAEPQRPTGPRDQAPARGRSHDRRGLRQQRPDGRQRQCRRDLDQCRRRLRAAKVRGAAGAPRRPRPPDGAREPPPIR